MVAGILLGLGAALCQSISYLFSTLFVRTFARSVRLLLVHSHVVMGLLCAVLFRVLGPPHLPPLTSFGRPLLLAALFYVVGQAGLFLALRWADASRVSPLLGLKLPILAGISIVFLGQSYSAPQWVAVALCLASAFLLNRSGGGVVRRGWLGILVACTGYCLSDLNIRELVQRLQASGLTLGQAALGGVCLSYVLCGAVAALLLPTVPWRDRRMWRFSVPFAVAWVGGMLFLFACFGTIGVVFGNIVQSTRGVLSVVLGAFLGGMGVIRLEARLSRGVFLRRCGAAVLMVLAIALFARG